MAISRKGSAPRKKKKDRATPNVKRGSKMKGPDFTGWENWTGEQFHNFRENAKRFYYENYNVQDLLPEVWAWMKENKYSANEIRAAKTRDIGPYIIINCKLLREGMPDFVPEHIKYWEKVSFLNTKLVPVSAWLKNQLNVAVEKGKVTLEQEKKDEKVETDSPSIQERVRQSAMSMIDEFESAIDDYIRDPDAFDPGAYKVANVLRGKEAKAIHARIIKDHYQKHLDEYDRVLNSKSTSELWEGYASYGKKNIKKIHAFLSNVVAACTQVAGEAKLNRKPRKKKAKTAETVVKKIKFKATDDRYGISSISPTQILGSQTVLVFNAKTRKIGLYISDGPGGLGVKGAGVTFFSDSSTQKTLRKPETQLKEFMQNNTAKRVWTLFDSINTTETKLNGRINSEVMILKAMK